jgi:hypothetical protein
MGFVRTIIRKAGTLIGVRRTLNLIEGTNVTLTIADDSVNDRVNVTIAASGGGSLPTQTGNNSKYLTTDGVSASWATVSASLPDLIITKQAPALNQTITDGYCAYYSGYYEIANTKFLEIGINSTLEIG